MALYQSAGWVRNVYKLSKLFIGESINYTLRNEWEATIEHYIFLYYPVLPQRTLFAEKSLGITDYEDRRLRLQDYAIRKKKLVYEMKSLDINSLVRTTKQFVHCTKGSPEEIIMLKQSLRLIHENTEGKSAYNFGPIVMRMFHYFNLPNEALEVRLLRNIDMWYRFQLTLFFALFSSATMFTYAKYLIRSVVT